MSKKRVLKTVVHRGGPYNGEIHPLDEEELPGTDDTLYYMSGGRYRVIRESTVYTVIWDGYENRTDN